MDEGYDFSERDFRMCGVSCREDDISEEHVSDGE